MTRARDLANFNLDGKAVTINESSADLDFRVESNDNANMLFVDGGNNRVGIGTNSPSSTLNVNSGAGNTNATFESSDATVLNLYKDSGGSAQISSTSGNLRIATGGDTSFSGLANYLTIGSGGDVTLDDGNLILASGHGINFDATSDSSGRTSELLDDYEEGTWTPGFTFDGTASGIVYTEQSGIYTKIGRQVTCTFDIRLSSNGSGTGAALMTGLPFTVGNLLTGTALEGGGLVTFHQQQGGSHTFMSVMPDDGSTTAQLHHDLDNVTDNTIIGNTSTMRGVFTYFTA